MRETKCFLPMETALIISILLHAVSYVDAILVIKATIEYKQSDRADTVNLCKTATQKIEKIKILMTNGSLMKVESIAKCSPSKVGNWS